MTMTRGDRFYYTMRPLVKFYLRSKFNIQVENNPLANMKDSYLLLGHHVTNFDPVISNAYAGRLIRYIAGDANQDNRITKFLLGVLESVPFAKNRADAKSIRALMKHVKEGHPIGLYPEGGRNWDGATDTLVPSTAKLIKMLKVPVYAMFYKGGFLSRPRWASNDRKGKMILDVVLLFDKETIEGNSAEDLQRMLVDKLHYNEFDWQRESKIPFKGKRLAEHIERLLYLCPKCQAVNSLHSHGDSFSCKECKVEYVLDQYGFIQGCPEFEETISWNKWQRTHLPRLVAKGFTFTSPSIELETTDLNNESKVNTTVDLIVFPDKLELKNSVGESVNINITDINSLSITFSDFLEFYVGKTKYRFKFNPQRHMSIRLFHDLIQTVKGGL